MNVFADDYVSIPQMMNKTQAIENTLKSFERFRKPRKNFQTFWIDLRQAFFWKESRSIKATI
jgi:hypothetical protein